MADSFPTFRRDPSTGLYTITYTDEAGVVRGVQFQGIDEVAPELGLAVEGRASPFQYNYRIKNGKTARQPLFSVKVACEPTAVAPSGAEPMACGTPSGPSFLGHSRIIVAGCFLTLQGNLLASRRGMSIPLARCAFSRPGFRECAREWPMARPERPSSRAFEMKRRKGSTSCSNRRSRISSS